MKIMSMMNKDQQKEEMIRKLRFGEETQFPNE